MTSLDSSAPASPSAPGNAPWDDDLWEVLLALIARDQVIPIVGPGLSMVETGGRRVTMDRYVAEQLAARLDIDQASLPEGFGLSAVVSEQARRRGPVYLYSKVNGILREAAFEPPPALMKLAQIPNFRLFVTTAYDTLLEQAIDKARGGGSRASESIGYSPAEVSFRDLEPSRDASITTVYHLLGLASALPEFVISDEDLLEYMVALQSDLKRPARLFDELSSHHLLILGGNFPDWLVRLFLRLAKRRRLSERSMESREVLADDRSYADAGLVSFLSSFSPSTQVVSGGAEAFVDELWRRWSAEYGDAVPAARQQPPSVFLSYARQDAAAAEALYKGLQAQGIHTWFDKGALQAGDNFDYKIREAIKSCPVFMPVVSRNTEADREQAYFRLEWSIADELDRRNAESVRFIVPVVVDGAPRDQLREVPPNFMRKHILMVDGGLPTAELIAALRSAMEGRR